MDKSLHLGIGKEETAGLLAQFSAVRLDRAGKHTVFIPVPEDVLDHCGDVFRLITTFGE